MIGKIQFQFVHQIGRKRVIKKIIYIFTLVRLKKTQWGRYDALWLGFYLYLPIAVGVLIKHWAHFFKLFIAMKNIDRVRNRACLTND